MYKFQPLAVSSVFLLLLMIISVFTSEYPYSVITSCGLLMIIYSIISFSEKTHPITSFLQIAVSTFFSVASGNISAFLVFSTLRVSRPLQIMLPPVVYFVSELIIMKKQLPETLLSVLILLMLSLVISAVNYSISRYNDAKTQIDKALKINALGELNEKKRSQELIIKNYLTEKNARFEEREAISRNIHNSVGHSVTAAIMTLDAADMLFETAPEKAREKMNAANKRIHGSLEAIRHAVRVLDTENTSISFSDFISSINTVAENFMLDTSIRIRINYPEDIAELLIPREHTEFLTGAFQELLTNGVRHGNADIFTSVINADSRHIKLSLIDNGKSDFSSENCSERIKNGFGLKKLISYADKCGGSAKFENTNGFISEITLPFNNMEVNNGN